MLPAAALGLGSDLGLALVLGLVLVVGLWLAGVAVGLLAAAGLVAPSPIARGASQPTAARITTNAVTTTAQTVRVSRRLLTKPECNPHTSPEQQRAATANVHPF